MQILIFKKSAHEIYHLWANQPNVDVSIVDEDNYLTSITSDEVLVICEPVFFKNVNDNIQKIRQQCTKVGQPFSFMLSFDETNTLVCQWAYMKTSWLRSIELNSIHALNVMEHLNVFSSQFINKIEYAKLPTEPARHLHKVAINRQLSSVIAAALQHAGVIICPDSTISLETIQISHSMILGHWDRYPGRVILSSPGCVDAIKDSPSASTLYHSINILKNLKPLKNVIIHYTNDITLRFLRQVAFASSNKNEYEFYLQSFINTELVTNNHQDLLNWGLKYYHYSWSANYVRCRLLYDTRHLFEIMPNSHIDIGPFWVNSHFLIHYDRAWAIYNKWLAFVRNNRISWTGSRLSC